MRKLKLKAESLRVDSFDTPAREEARGTVRAHWWTLRAEDDTCAFSCMDSDAVHQCDSTFCDPSCAYHPC